MRKWLTLALLLLAAPAVAQEARCTALGAQCICSEQLNTATYQLHHLDAGGAEQWDPIDSNTTKQCSQEILNYAVIVEDPGPVARSAASDPAVFSALPSGHLLTRVISKAPGGGRMEVGAAGLQTVPGVGTYPQINARWYYYHSSNFAWKTSDTDPCINTKWTETHPTSLDNRIDYTNGLHTYNYLPGSGWSGGFDCCGSGPGPNAGLANSNYSGKWWRWEVIIGARTGTNYRMTMWGKNITDNGPELLMIDTDAAPLSSSVFPSSTVINAVVTNWNRFDNPAIGGEGCIGFRAMTHYILAGFPTINHTTNRIGAATEVESGGGAPNAYSLPGGAGGIALGITGAIATLTKLPGPTQIGFIHTAAVLIVVIVALLIVRRTHR